MRNALLAAGIVAGMTAARRRAGGAGLHQRLVLRRQPDRPRQPLRRDRPAAVAALLRGPPVERPGLGRACRRRLRRARPRHRQLRLRRRPRAAERRRRPVPDPRPRRPAGELRRPRDQAARRAAGGDALVRRQRRHRRDRGRPHPGERRRRGRRRGPGGRRRHRHAARPRRQGLRPAQPALARPGPGLHRRAAGRGGAGRRRQRPLQRHPRRADRRDEGQAPDQADRHGRDLRRPDRQPAEVRRRGRDAALHRLPGARSAAPTRPTGWPSSTRCTRTG